MIEKIKSKYIIMDEYGYTDAEMVNKVNEIIDAVNKISAEKCRWKLKRMDYAGAYYHVTCLGKLYCSVLEEFKYCPYCGKEIEIDD